MNVNALPALFLVALGASAAIQDVDFKNFAYPFIEREFVSVPDQLRWMPRTRANSLSLRDGEYRFPCHDAPCALLTIGQIQFGSINGLPGINAIVAAVYHTGGTANWQYLYVIALRSGKPTVRAWLEAGSRADMGLRRFAIDTGDVVLVVNDPDKRQGDCCSTGTITFRYRWHDGSFHQVGKPVLADDPQ